MNKHRPSPENEEQSVVIVFVKDSTQHRTSLYYNKQNMLGVIIMQSFLSLNYTFIYEELRIEEVGYESYGS
jgi:hypothetical protein